MGKYLSRLRRSLSPERFPFEALPDVCKMQVFSYLEVADRVAVSMVCKEWNHMIRSPALWANIDVTQAIKESQHGQAQKYSVRESEHRLRTIKFLSYICNIHPVIRRLVLVGDIADADLNDNIQTFTRYSNLAEMQEFIVDWTQSTKTIEPLVTDNNTLVPVDESHRRRQRLFVRFFEHLARAAPNLKSLALPFDWSVKSVDAIISLRKLESVSLSRYSDLQTLDIATMDHLICSMPELRHLKIEVWTPCALGGFSYYRIRSDSLETFDLSECRGVALGEVYLPKVRVLRVSRSPWTGPLLVTSSSDMSTDPPPPCLYRLLVSGAPFLKQLNEHVLRPNWQSETYDGLEEILKSVCPCELHCISTDESENLCI